MEMSPNCTSRRRISLASVVTRRAPVAANGWPMAIDPPITLVRSQSTSPTGPGSPSRSAQLREPHACDVGEHLRGEGLVDLDQPEIAPGDPGALERLRHRVDRTHQELPAGIHRAHGVAPQKGERLRSRARPPSPPP